MRSYLSILLVLMCVCPLIERDVLSAATGPPSLNIDPKDTKIRLLGNAAVVTFHLGERARRTVVFEQRDRGWVIVHLHASSTPQVQ